jgi:hypothetical protein
VSAVITIDRAIFEIEFKWTEGYRDALVEIWTTTNSGNAPGHLIAAMLISVAWKREAPISITKREAPISIKWRLREAVPPPLPQCARCALNSAEQLSKTGWVAGRPPCDGAGFLN